jgi:acetyl-CoA synthetase (ADP-forming)
MTTPSTTLSEAASKRLLAGYGLPLADERVVTTADEAAVAAAAIGYPVVVKLCGDAIAHKTERGLVRLRVGDERAVRTASTELLEAALPTDGEVALLIAPMVVGTRELIAGILRDRQFGPTVMLGVGGVLAEAVADVVFRPAPIDGPTAAEMIDDLATQRLLGAFRGEAAVQREHVVDVPSNDRMSRASTSTRSSSIPPASRWPSMRSSSSEAAPVSARYCGHARRLTSSRRCSHRVVCW